MKRVIVYVAVIGFWLCVLFPVGCGPAKEGEFCTATKDCTEGLRCLRQRCVKPTIVPADDASTPDDEPVVGNDQPGVDDTPADQSADQSPQDRSAPAERSAPEPGKEPGAEPTTPDQVAERTAPEPPPERATPDTPSGPLSLYDILDPSSGKNPKEGDQIQTSEAIVTTPLVRLSSSLNVFFVQAAKPENGSYKYGGMMVVYKRQDYPSLPLSLGTIVELKGKFIVFRGVDWNSVCNVNTDCTNPQFSACKEVYNTQTSMVEKHCVSAAGMPQLELSAAPVTRGNAPLPPPTVVKPVDIRSAPGANAYLGVLLQLDNVVVTSANPDKPKDYSEFSVAEANDKTNDIRVDDMLNTVQYTGSKYCAGCNSSPKTPDTSYCLPGDTCQCKGTFGSCHAGTATADRRALNDTWTKLIGVLRYANDNYKLQPRIPTDMQ